MTKKLIQPSEVDPKVSDEARGVIAQLILCWANYETSLTKFLLVAFGASLDKGSILVGTMDTRTKLDRLKSLYTHHGMTEAATSIRNNLNNIHKHFVEVRNAVAHSACLGHLAENPEYLMFSSGRLDHGSKGLMSGTGYSLKKMREASAFALAAGDLLINHVDFRRMRRSKPPLGPPSFQIQPQPTPQKLGKGKRNKPPKSSQE